MRHDTLIMTTIGAVLLGASALSWSDDDRRWGGRGGADIHPPTDATYLAECGSCHQAYPPGLLPGRSWGRLLAGLDDHFGDNAELAPETLTRIATYLAANAAERGDGWIAERIAATVPAQATPLRISELGYIQRKHDELPAGLVQGNPQVGSLGNCIACHRGADQGMFDEHRVEIPGQGRWGD